MTGDAREYEDLLHRLTRLHDADTEEAAAARDALAADTAAVEALRGAVTDEAERITRATGVLNAPVLDLRAPADPVAEPKPLRRELRDARDALAEAAAARKAAVEAGRLPALLPRAHHLVRNTAVYAGVLAAVFLVQIVLYHGLADPGATLWIACLPPVAGLLAGYVTVGAVSRPRVPTLDKNGDPIAFRVYKSPRLGVALAVVAIVGFVLVVGGPG